MSIIENKQTVLVIDDEVQIRRLLRATLEGHFRVCEAATGKEGLMEVAQCRPDIVLLDLGLPDMDGVNVLKRIREWNRVPVVVLSVRDGVDDKVAALDQDADDYLTKPFSTGELLARIRVALRHAEPRTEAPVFQSGDLAVDFTTRTVTVKGKAVKLTSTEYGILRLLAQHAGKVLTHQHLLREVWGPTYVEQTHYLRVYIAHLREKLEKDPAHPTILINEPAIGYRLLEHDEN